MSIAHAEGPVAETDKERTRWLESEGYRVLRFWNNDVVRNVDGVLEAIHNAMSSAMTFDEPLKHSRHRDWAMTESTTPPRRFARRPSPCWGG
ncbi:MAG TPA: DUF559 domain-containing protein [Xanthobacteraceae bacterium]|jgi:hypothetical protein